MTAAAEDIARFRRLAAHALGLNLDDTRDDLLGRVLERRAIALGLPVSRYLELGARSRRDELRLVAGDLTVGETYFFRHVEQLRALLDDAVRERVAQGRPANGLRILSAGCATGEEPYTLAMLLLERGIELPPGSIRAVDVSARSLAHAAAATYSPWALRETSAAARDRFFEVVGNEHRVAAPVRATVQFEQRNLADEDDELGEDRCFDVVVCRNVLMYFAPERAREVVARFQRLLAPGGFLVLGHAETLRNLSAAFDLRHTNGAFYYQLAATPRALSLEGGPPAVREPLDPAWVGAIHDASERVRRITDGSPTAPATERPAGDAVGAALDLMRRERFQEALTSLDDASQPPTSDVLLLRAVLLTQTGDVAGAERTCTDLIASAPLHAGAHYVLAVCREAAGDGDGALDRARMATYLDPAFALPRLQLGLAARRRGDLATARSELGRALELLPAEDATRIALFGGGFTRDGLLALCRAELRRAGGAV